VTRSYYQEITNRGQGYAAACGQDLGYRDAAITAK